MNKAPSSMSDARGAAEMAEERGLTKGNLDKNARRRTQRRRTKMESTKGVEKEKSGVSANGGVEPEGLLSGLELVREAAKRDSEIRFTSLFHHLTVDALRESYLKLNPKAAAGVDEVTWAE